MKTPRTFYRNTLQTRYASSSMLEIFSEEHRALLWRELWILLAEEELKLGLPIQPEQIQALEKVKKNISLDRIDALEKNIKHDVMSHLKAFAEKAPKAEPILHLGATSATITDNADALIFRKAVHLLQKKIAVLLRILGKLMMTYKNLEMTGYTHFQPAQPVTLGKRFALWAQELLWDFEELQFCLNRLRPLGCKGATGTQASFMVLFQNNFKKVEALDRAICERMGFFEPVPLSGQTLSRKIDTWFLHALANLASSFSKISYDLRLLQHLQEVMEPFSENQVGSSAMPYKQNPMLAERLTGLSRFLMNLVPNGTWTQATQWLERSLDDSSNRRLVLPEAFLTADALCEIAYRLFKGLRINKKLIESNRLSHQASFETEIEMMEKTLKGESRQKLHEKFRRSMLKGKLKASRKKGYKLSGAASQQVGQFYKNILEPFLKRHLVKSKIFGSSPSPL